MAMKGSSRDGPFSRRMHVSYAAHTWFISSATNKQSELTCSSLVPAAATYSRTHPTSFYFYAYPDKKSLLLPFCSHAP